MKIALRATTMKIGGHREHLMEEAVWGQHREHLHNPNEETCKEQLLVS